MNIQRQESETKGAFFYEDKGIKLAEMTYSKAGPKLIIIDHTEVSDTLRGKGAGKQMVYQSVLFARENGLRIMPLCPFAKAAFMKVKEWQDVLK